MLTPVDIENKEFTKAFRGYDIYEVEEFMKGLVADYEKLYRENGELKEKNILLNEAIGNYKGMEETMQNAILVAQRTAEDIKQNAYERSETIIKDAERRAAEAVNNANNSLGHIEKAYLSMQQEMNGFKAKMNALLSTYMQLLNDLPEQIAPKKYPMPIAVDESEAPVAAAIPEVPAPVAPVAKQEPNPEDTNTFIMPKAVASTDAEEEETPRVSPIPEGAGFITERTPNPLVEELLKKNREERKNEMFSPSDESVSKEKPKDFSVTKETIQKESKSVISEINVENLKAYDVFSDDTI